MLKIVLWRNKNPWQIWGASIGVFIGLLLLLFALQVYFDIQILVHGARDSNVLILNKKLRTSTERGFTVQDIDEMRKKRFFNSVEPFESNRYEVWADMDRLGFSTMLFFQSISDTFLDVKSKDFKWKPGDTLIPVIMSNDYLTLYNFGFGAGQGLPKITADFLTTLKFDIIISSKTKKQKFTGYICGFTQNINSILVPKPFMEYANTEFGFQKQKDPNQVAISTDNPYNKNMVKFLEEKDLEISRGGLIGGELKSALFLLVSLVLMIGAIIIGLSLLVFVLNFQLLIAQSSADIRLLLELGYKQQSITANLSKRLIFIFIIIAVLVFAILYPIKQIMTRGLIVEGYDKLSLFVNPIVVIAGLAFCLLFVWINYMVISRNVKKLA